MAPIIGRDPPEKKSPIDITLCACGICYVPVSLDASPGHVLRPFCRFVADGADFAESEGRRGAYLRPAAQI
jgi:hypothetical protein